MNDYKTIKYEMDAGILTITLNRPDKLNALNMDMFEEILDALNRADKDDNVGVVIFTGAGRAFCAGADLSGGANTFDFSQSHTQQPDDASEFPRDGGGILTLRIFDLRKPVLAAVNGPAVGFGLSFQLAMDLRLASESAKFGFVFARRGIVPEACSSWFLPRIVGISRALEWTLSGRIFLPEEALSGGLIRSIHKPEELLPAARALAREIIDNTAPVSVALTRQMYWKMLGADHPMEAHKIDSRGMATRGRSADAQEGIVSFLEKRPAHFPNRVSVDMPAFYPWWQPPQFK